MHRAFQLITAWLALIGGWACAQAMQPVTDAGDTTARQTPTQAHLLGPPTDNGPVVVRTRFDLHNINEINDEAETFEFTGVLTLQWHDPRQAFNPAVEGANEKVFQGAYQFDEVATGWYPQVILTNESGLFQTSGVVLRVRPDGTSTLVTTLNAAAESDLNMRRFPLDAHRLEAVFEVLGFHREEVVFRLMEHGSSVDGGLSIEVPQWNVAAIKMDVRERATTYAGHPGVSSSFAFSVEVRREPFYIVRLIVFPLMVIVLLSFAVFWMDRSSPGDRISVSFIGILTGVAYQIVMSDHMPRIAYFTLMHAFLNISFLTMCATVLVNLVVGGLGKQGREAAADRLDRRCRWLFPLCYLGLNGVILLLALKI